MNIQITKYSYLNDNALIAWYAQYGTPSQSSYYPNLRKKRAKVMRKLIEEGIDISDFNGYTVDGSTGEVHLPAYNRYNRS